jgi:uncharacterized protein
MKKVLSILVSLLVVCTLALPVFAATNPLVVDEADLMSDYEEQLLTETLEEISARLELDVVAVTVDSTGGKSTMEFADDFFDYNGYGQGANHDGVILVINMDEREYWVSTTGYAITAITDYSIEMIGDSVVPYMKDGDYYGAYDKYARIVDDLVTSAKSGSVYDWDNKYNGYGEYAYGDGYYDEYGSSGMDSFERIGTAGIVSLIISAIIVLMVKKSYKPVAFNRSASNYLNSGSLNVTNSYEHYLYNHVTMTKRVEESSSSHSGGSSTHTSSSGTSHGGGGGHF